MSVVCCKVYEDRIEIAADSITVRGWTQSKGKNNDMSKLMVIDDIVIGGVGYSQEIVLMQLYCKTHKPRDNSQISIVEFLSEFSDWKKNKTDNGNIEGSYIIVFDGKAYVTFGFGVSEVTEYEAIGAGVDFALSALYLNNNVVKAIETACELSVYCEKPVIHHKIKLK
jgi:ATP-dependent protease HslVU (ClpYQ) peptidase subunit